MTPSGPGPFGVVVLLHGGFWRERYRRDLMAPLAADLAARGLAAYNVEYRRLDCGGGWPETGEDVLAAIDHLARLDAPLDLDDIAVVGHSAGGHLALWAGAERGAGGERCGGSASGVRAAPKVRVRRVVGQAAVSDLEEGIRLRLGDGVVERFAADAPMDVASPIRRAPLPARVLLVHGTEDDTVPASFSDGFPGAEVSLREGEGHYEHIDPASAAWAEVRTWLLTR